MGFINPYYWVDDHPLLYGNSGSLDPSTCARLEKNHTQIHWSLFSHSEWKQMSQMTLSASFSDEHLSMRTLKKIGENSKFTIQPLFILV